MKNDMDKYELIDGTAIINNKFVIINANESLYKFMGVATFYSIIDIIHQVDLDDFVDVANGLRINAEKTMVIRMKRFDNSFRWMLTKVKRISTSFEENAGKEFIEITVSDIMALEKQRISFRETLFTTNSVLPLDGEIYYTYDCQTKIIIFSSYVDNQLTEMSECPIQNWLDALVDEQSSQSDSAFEVIALQNDFLHCKSEFFHHLQSNYFSSSNDFENLEIKGVVLMEQMQPKAILGSIRNTDVFGLGYTKHTYEHSRHSELLSFDEVSNYVTENIALNPKCEMNLILMQIDDFDQLTRQLGEKATEAFYDSIIFTAKELVGYRGVVGEYKKGILYIAIKNIASELNTRAFVESLRSNIAWNHRLLDGTISHTSSIGISRRPTNASNYETLLKMAARALDIANEKGHNRFIIYINNLHGNIE